jgi:hypothetical protein
MQITRIPPFPLTLDVAGLDASTDYIVTILSDHSADLVEIPVTSDVDGLLSTPLPNFFARYDDDYRLEIYLSNSGELGDLVHVDTLTINRPYVNPADLTSDPSEIDTATMYEAVARAIIDSVTGGFQFKRTAVEVVGMGADYLFVPYRLNKIVKVYENDVCVFDAESTDPDWTNAKNYIITPDKSAITVGIANSTGLNRYQSKPVKTRNGASDSYALLNTNDSPNFNMAVYDTKTFADLSGNYAMFPSDWDYTLILETGWPIIPQDIQTATRLLVNDLKCNSIPYMNAYIKEYESDQFKIKFADGVFKDTGNKIVDKILSNYSSQMYRLGVL